MKKPYLYLIILALTFLISIFISQDERTSGLVKNASAAQTLQISLGLPIDKLDPVVFSPDGNILAIIGEGGAITLHDVASGHTLWVHFDTINDVVTGLAFSPDGKTLASVGKNAVNLWDVELGQELKSHPLTITASAIVQLSFSPDGKLLAGVSLENDILLLNLETGLLKTIKSSHGVTVDQLIFSPDGKMLVSANNGQQPAVKSTINLWDAATGQLNAALSADTIVTDIAFSPNSGIFASAGQDGLITLWNSQSKVVQRIIDTKEQITGLAFSPDGKGLAIGSSGTDPKVQLWNPVTGVLIFTHPAEGGTAVANLFYSPDGALLASIGEDFRISLWNVPTGKLQHLLVGQTDIIAKAAFNLKQPSLSAFGKDGQLIVWDLVTGLEQLSSQIPTLFSATLTSSLIPVSANTVSTVSSQLTASNVTSGANNAAVTNASSQIVRAKAAAPIKKRSTQKFKGVEELSFNQDGTEFATAGVDGIVRVFNKKGGSIWKVSGHHGNAVTGVAFRGKTKEWVSVGRDTEIKTWSEAGKNLQVFHGPEHSPRTVAVSQDGRFIAAAGEDTRIFLFDAVSGKLNKIFSGHIDFVNGLAFGPGGRLASAGAEGRILLWDVNTGKLIRSLLGHSGEVNAVAFSPDGGVIASAGLDSTVILWDATTGVQIKQLTGHQGSVRSVAFSPNGKKLVSAGEDTSIFVWNTATGLLMKKLAGPPAAINSLAFSPDGNLHIGSENSAVTEVNTDTGTKINTIVVPVSSTIAPLSSRSEELNLAMMTNSGVQSLSLFVEKPRMKSVKPSQVTLSSVVNQILDWVIPAANAADPNQGPGPDGSGSILVVTTATNLYGNYYAEILRTEGLNEFRVADITTVTAATLASYDVVILAQMPLTAVQVTMFDNWVTINGGNLIAMRPDKQLAGFLGLTDASSTLNNGYLLVNTNVSPGNGIFGETMQFHGVADRYTLNGATSIASLYNDAATTTSNPAVTLTSVGNVGGQAAAFTYDLATSIVYTRQGNPAWATQERDGFTPIRSDDKFFGQASGDPQVDWIDLNKIAIPQGDEQQRLLVNLILEMNRDKKPLPRFWYFPFGFKAAVIMTGDDHANGGTAGRFDYFLAHSPAGCSVQNWECVRGTSYMYPNTPLTTTQAASYNAQGFEVGLHINTNCADFTPASLEAFYADQISTWTAKYSTIPAPITQRHHCIAWSDWVTGAKVQLNHGIRFDTSFYFWPPSWVLNRPGFFTGSGMPMRFADVNGSMIDVYNATSQMTDESGQSYPFTINTLLDSAVGSKEFYGAFTINAHTDLDTEPESETTVTSAQARGVPIVTSLQMMNWLDARNSSYFSGMTWASNTLSFTVTQGSGATNGLQALLPMQSTAGILTSLTKGGTSIVFNPTTIKGVDYAAFSGVTGSYVATYAQDITAPTVTVKSPAAGATNVNIGSVITATFSEIINSATINSSTFELRDSSNNPVAATVSYNASTRTATLTPSATLTASTTYTTTVKGGATDPRVKDSVGNALAASVIWTFTTDVQPCASSSCSAWSSTTIPSNSQANDPGSVELGVKFRSDISGLITGIRFYQTNSNAGAGRTFQATLWDLVTQAPLATGTIITTASGWLQVNFPTSFAISANTVYVASYHAPNGNYAGDNGFFTASGIDNAPIHLLKDGENGGNGVYAYGASRSYPSSTYQSSNYWVDVVFSTNTGSDTTAPTVNSTVPTANATGVNPANPVTVTFSEAMTAASISNSTLQLQDPTNTIVSATVSYTSGTNTATLTPTNSLSASTVYHATVKSGASGVKDSAGNPLAVDKTWSFTTGVDSCLLGGNPIVCENSKLGTPSSVWDISGAGDASIQGFTTEISVNKGSTVTFKIDANAPNTADYRLDIYRMGYYNGNGARLVATVLPTSSTAQTQPACNKDAATGLIDCSNWADSASWPVPIDATSGVYFAKVIRLDGANANKASHIVFIVRDDASNSDILFQTSDTTWQAYNNYGGNSFYQGTGPGTGGSSNGRAYKVSYNRPFNTRAVDGGQDWVFNSEYPMVRWLEANGYNVSYFTGIDSHRSGSLILNHKVFMSTGHDEYWSGQQRANVEAARDSAAKVNLAFFSGNEVFWKTRLENNIINSSGTLGAVANRTLVCYKETHDFNNNPDPQTTTWTGTWRDPRALSLIPSKDGGRPENALTGTLFMVNDGATTAIEVPEADGKMRFWRGTSIANLAPNTSFTLPNGTLGYEWDIDADNGSRSAGTVRLSTTIVNNAPILTDFGSTFGSGTANHALTLHKAANGAIVFGAGTVQWAWGLDNIHDRAGTPVDVSMKQATVNLFADMQVQPSTLQAGLFSATISNDTTPPTSVISSPASGATIVLGSVVTINGTAADNAGITGGKVGGVEVSVDGGLTWHPASGRTSWTYSWTAPNINSQVNIMSRAVDDSLNLETPGGGVTVNVGTGLDNIAPTPPSGLTATVNSSTQITLNWVASTDAGGLAAVPYQVERCLASACSFAQIGTSTPTTFVNSGLTANTTYQYRVRTVDLAGNLSAYSTVVVSTTLTAPPPAPTAINDRFLFRANVLRTADSAGLLGLGVLANDTAPGNPVLTAQAVGVLPAGVTLASNGVVTINRGTATSFRYRANNGGTLSLPTTGALATLSIDAAPAAAVDTCTYNRTGTGSITAGGTVCAMTGTRIFSMNLIANDTDTNVSTNVPTDGVGKTVSNAVITSVGTGVSVLVNASCGQTAIGTSTARAKITNNCNGTLSIEVGIAAPASAITFSYRAVDDLGAQTATARADTVTVN